MNVPGLVVLAPTLCGSVQDWLLIDAGETIFNVFTEEAHKEYDLETLWSAQRPVTPLPA